MQVLGAGSRNCTFIKHRDYVAPRDTDPGALGAGSLQAFRPKRSLSVAALQPSSVHPPFGVTDTPNSVPWERHFSLPPVPPHTVSGVCLTPFHKLNLTLPPQASLLLGFLPDPVIDFALDILSPAHGVHPHIIKLMVSKLIFPVWLLSLASCLGTHRLPLAFTSMNPGISVCAPSSFTSYVRGRHLALNWTPKSHPTLASY